MSKAPPDPLLVATRVRQAATIGLLATGVYMLYRYSSAPSEERRERHLLRFRELTHGITPATPDQKAMPHVDVQWVRHGTMQSDPRHAHLPAIGTTRHAIGHEWGAPTPRPHPAVYDKHLMAQDVLARDSTK